MTQKNEKSTKQKMYCPNVLLMGSEEPIKKKKVVEKKVDEPPKIWDVIDEIKNDKSEKKNSDCLGCKSKGCFVEDQSGGVVVCSNCGMIEEDIIDRGPEKRQFMNDDSRGEVNSRYGCPSNYFFPKSSQGTILAGTGNSRLKRRQKWNSSVYRERSLNSVFELMNQKGVDLNVSKCIIDTAQLLCKKVSDYKHTDGENAGKTIIIRGENRTGIWAGCFFKSCESHGEFRSIKEISAAFSVSEKKVTKGIKQCDVILKNLGDDSFTDNLDTNTTEDYIKRFGKKLKIPKKYLDVGVTISQNCCKMKLVSDHNSQSVAASIILTLSICYDLDLNKKYVAKLFGTSDVTINKIYHKIEPYLEALVDNEATNYLIEKFQINK